MGMVMKGVTGMAENMPKNIVEAYKRASQEVEKNPESRNAEYTKVVNFCDGNEECHWENSIKRNMLLFWSYDNMAEDEVEHKHYRQALEIWKKAKNLPKSAMVRAEVGQKMLDAVDKGNMSIPEKTDEIVEICRYLQRAYQDLGDEENAEKMARLEKAAGNLMKSTKGKN